MSYLWLALWFALMGGSVAAHEAAHVFAGKHFGWTYNGIIFKPWLLAIGVQLDPPEGDDKDLWKIAAAGPVITAEIAGLFWHLQDLGGQAGAIFGSLFAFNAVLLVINLAPFPFTDGGLIVRGLRDRSTA